MTHDIDLDALTALEKAIPPAPWHVADSQPFPGIRTPAGWEVVYASYADTAKVLDFIAAARNHLPALLSALTATRAELERYRIELRDKGNDLLDIRGALSPNGYPRRVPMELGATVAPAIEWLLNDRDAARAELEQARAVVEAARLCVADIKAAWSDERNGPWLTAGQRALYAALDAHDTASDAGAGDGEQDTATCGHAYIGNVGEFTCNRYVHTEGRHWNSLAEFGWTDDSADGGQR